jgi:hypothetical protein
VHDATERWGWEAMCGRLRGNGWYWGSVWKKGHGEGGAVYSCVKKIGLDNTGKSLLCITKAAEAPMLKPPFDRQIQPVCMDAELRCT